MSPAARPVSELVKGRPLVGVEPIIADSARKHGVSDEAILHAYANPVRVFELNEGFTMVIGANRASSTRLGSSTGRRRRSSFTPCPSEVSEVMTMPRTVQEILDHADELAQRFGDYEPSADDERDPEAFAALRRAVILRSEAEKSIKDAVDQARRNGYSWTLIGTPGEAARQRYGRKQNT